MLNRRARDDGGRVGEGHTAVYTESIQGVRSAELAVRTELGRRVGGVEGWGVGGRGVTLRGVPDRTREQLGRREGGVTRKRRPSLLEINKCHFGIQCSKKKHNQRS